MWLRISSEEHAFRFNFMILFQPQNMKAVENVYWLPLIDIYNILITIYRKKKSVVLYGIDQEEENDELLPNTDLIHISICVLMAEKISADHYVQK